MNKNVSFSGISLKVWARGKEKLRLAKFRFLARSNVLGILVILLVGLNFFAVFRIDGKERSKSNLPIQSNSSSRKSISTAYALTNNHQFLASFVQPEKRSLLNDTAADRLQFMSQTSLRQRQRTKPIFGRVSMQLPIPIFVASLPKSATTSVHGFFTCGGYKSAHHFSRLDLLIGECFESNVGRGRPPLDGCGNFSVWSDTGYATTGTKCYFPSVDGLDVFYEHYPNATILLMTRSTDSWYSSLERYYGGLVKRKMETCNATGFPDVNATITDWKNMYEWHQKRVRRFATSHPSITFLEFSAEDPKVSQKLQAATGINRSCWKVENVYNRKTEIH